MPVFVFRCASCGRDFERLLFSRNTSVSCPGCGSAEVVKRPTAFAAQGTEKKVAGGRSCAGCSAGSCSSCGCA